MSRSSRAAGARTPSVLLLFVTLASCGGDDGTSMGASCTALAACEADVGDPGATDGSDGGASPDVARDAGPSDGAGDGSAGDASGADAQSRLVAPDALGDLLAGAGVVLIDARGAGDYAAGHLVGALSVDVSGALRATVDGVPGQLPPLDQVAAVLSQAGVPADGSAVVYGASSDLNAARLAWTLEYLGHPDVRLLDGGYAAQPALGAEIETGADDAPRSDFPSDGVDTDRRVDAAWVRTHLGDRNVVFVDARSAGEYAAGHIPGAVSLDWQGNVEGIELRPIGELRARHAELPEQATLVAYCQTGSRAAMAYFVMRYLGFSDVRLYDGSMVEWTADPDNPIEP